MDAKLRFLVSACASKGGSFCLENSRPKVEVLDVDELSVFLSMLWFEKCTSGDGPNLYFRVLYAAVFALLGVVTVSL